MSPARRTSSLVAVLLVSAVGGVLTGCSSSPQGISGPAAEELPVSGGTLLVSGPFDESGGERITGTPTFVSGCLGAKNDEQSFVVVWPDGTAVTDNEEDIISVDGHELTPGSTFVAHGSFVHPPFPEQLPEIPLKCQTGDLTAVAWIHEVDSVEE